MLTEQSEHPKQFRCNVYIIQEAYLLHVKQEIIADAYLNCNIQTKVSGSLKLDSPASANSSPEGNWSAPARRAAGSFG